MPNPFNEFFGVGASLRAAGMAARKARMAAERRVEGLASGAGSTSHFYRVADPSSALLCNSRSVGRALHAAASSRSRSVGRSLRALDRYIT